MADFSTTDNSKAPKHTVADAAQGIRIEPGPFVGIVKHNIDPKRSGRLTVWIKDLGGSEDDPSSWRTVQYASPFYGVTPPPMTADGQLDKRPSGDNFESNPHSYGFWMVPPDLDTQVLCIFVKGDPERGYWFACVPEWPNMHMVPAIAGNETNPLPQVEFNPDDVGRNELVDFPTRQRPAHQYLVQQLSAQGLSNDKERGVITSSAFRESPSTVFGFSTPGRSLDDTSLLEPAPEQNVPSGSTIITDGTLTQDQADQQQVQQQQQQQSQQSTRNNGKGRKGGHSFVMDDGDVDGNNQLVRIRSAGGNMIMMNDTSGFVYIINKKGTAWLELDSAGGVNIYSDTDIKFAAKNNIYLDAVNGGVKIHGKNAVDIVADATLNLTGKGAVNVNSDKVTKVTGKDGLHLKGKNTYLTGDSCVQIKGGQHLDLGAGCINLNCGSPTPAQAASSGQAPQGMPTKEPWSGHLKGPGGSGTSKSLGANFGQSNAISGNYGKAADYSGVGNNTKDSVNNGFIGSTGGSGPGATGFRQGTESAPTSSSTAVGDYRGYPNLNGQPGVGSGQCVALVAAYSDCGHVSGWRPTSNQTLFDNPPQPGAVIATMKDGYYANQPTGNHAAIYLGQGSDERGRYILVQEQNVAKNEYGQKVISERRIYERSGGSDSNNASTYRQVANKDHPEGVFVRNAPPVKQDANKEPGDGIKTPDDVQNQKDRPDVNDPKKGYVSPEEEQKNRDQLRAEEAKGGDASAGGAEPTKIDGSMANARQQEINDANNPKDPASLQDSVAKEKTLQDNLDKSNTKAEQDLAAGNITLEEYNKTISDNNKAAQESIDRQTASQNALDNQDSAASKAAAISYQEADPPPTSFDRDRNYSQEVADSRATGAEQPAPTNPYASGSYDAMGNYTGAGDDFKSTPTGSPTQGTDFNAQAAINDQIGSPRYDDVPMPTKQDVTPPEPPGEPSYGSDAIDGGSKNFVSGNNTEPGKGGQQGPGGAPQNNSPQAAGGPSC